MIQDPVTKALRPQTDEEAWEDARALVRHYVAIGYPCEVIGALMKPPMSDRTVRKYFPHEIQHGLLIQNAKVAGTAYQLAVSGRDPAMTRWWLERRGGWTLPRDNGETGPIPIQTIPGDD